MSEAALQAKRPRRRSSSIVDYRFVTLGLEKDNDSDLDFVPDDDEEEEGTEEEAELDVSEEGGEAVAEDEEEEEDESVSTVMVADTPYEAEGFGLTVGVTGAESSSSEGAGDAVNGGTRGRRLPQKRSKDMSSLIRPEKRRKKTKDHFVGCTLSSDEESVDLTGMEYNPRHRKAGVEAEKLALEKTHEAVHNRVPPLVVHRFRSWAAVTEKLKEYQKKYNLLFRVRSSTRTERHNKDCKTEDEIPVDQFLWTQRIFRCTHGVLQKSRSTGGRSRAVRYTGCNARFTASVVKTSKGHFQIVVHNECHTHNHQTTRSVASSYQTRKGLSLNQRDEEDVMLLADNDVSSKHISNMLSERTGLAVSPQQARNLIRDIMGKDSAEDRVKSMLHELVQQDGCDVRVLQDQNDTTSGVILQTKLQKLMFEQWGQTLAMDFTHGTNNLGYHLGSIVVTTATGRGFPVIDFLCLDEQAPTIAKILDTFKAWNPTWNSVRSVVIDKDFVEWRELEKAFPLSAVLLCQFHTISYWKKLSRRSSYGLTTAQSEQIIAHLTNLIYSTTKSRYEKYRKAFRTYCVNFKKVAIYQYFEKNWHSCRKMWANYARGTFFTAGNTTTNRVESNWNQIKLLLGRKSRFDKTVAGILQHQITVTQQILRTLSKAVTTSSKSVPFLNQVAARLSPAVFKKVKKEWERYMVLLHNSTCRRKANTISQWSVTCSSGTYHCHDLDWTCSCLFYATHHLPCRHLMRLARAGRGWRVLPGSAISGRWSVQLTPDWTKELENAASALGSIVRMSKLRSPKTKLPKETLSGHTSDGPISMHAKKEKQIEYVRLRRNEHANVVVLSSAEKYTYAKALFEPVLEHLSSLGTADFYQGLESWKKLIDTGLSDRSPAKSCSSNEHGDDDDASDTFYDEEELHDYLDPAEELDTLNLMKSMEGLEEMNEPEDSDSGSVGDTNRQSGETLQLHDDIEMLFDNYKSSGANSDAPSGYEASSDGEEGSNHRQKKVGNDDKVAARKQSETPALQTPDPLKVQRQVDIIKMPKPPRRTNARVKLTQRKIPSYIRYATVKYPSDLAVNVHQICFWARLMPDLKFVREILEAYPLIMDEPYLRGRTLECEWKTIRPEDYRYNFIIPHDLVTSLQASFKSCPDDTIRISEETKRQGFVRNKVITMDSKLKPFSEDFVNSMAGFNGVLRLSKHWMEDMKWIERDWENIASNHVGLFAEETNTIGLDDAGIRVRHQELADQIIPKFRTARLRTRFHLPTAESSILFEQIVGHLCRDMLLNDTTIELCIRYIGDAAGNCFVLSSLVCEHGWPKTTPQRSITEVKYVVQPVNLSENHWGVIIAVLDFDEKAKTSRIHAMLYEPIISGDYEEEMEDVWEEGFLDFILRWHNTSLPGYRAPVIDPIEWILSPQQPDWKSCGVLVIAQVYRRIKSIDFQDHLVTKADVEVMRLRSLWVLITILYEVPIDEADDIAARETHKQLCRTLADGKPMPW